MKKDQKPLALCSIDDIPAGSARGFTVNSSPPKSIVGLNMADKVFIYENRCPHVGTPLDWIPDQFLDESKSLIQCATHGALFRPEDGFCIAGPCSGQSLNQIPYEVRNNIIYIVEI